MIDITKMSLEELKALGYDQWVLLQQTQANLNLINAEIVKKQDGSGS